MKILSYKGYIAQVTLDQDTEMLHGLVTGLKDVITFEGRSVKDLKKAFKDSVNDYLNFCKERGEEPEKPYSGNIRLRLTSDLHRRLAASAQSLEVSINQFIQNAITDYLKVSA